MSGEGRREEARAESRISGEAPVKPEQARLRVCAVCGAGNGRTLTDCGAEFICTLCLIPGEANRAKVAGQRMPL